MPSSIGSYTTRTGSPSRARACAKPPPSAPDLTPQPGREPIKPPIGADCPRSSVKEESPTHHRRYPSSNRTKRAVAGGREDGGAAQSHVDRLGKLLQPGTGPHGVSGDRPLHPASRNGARD